MAANSGTSHILVTELVFGNTNDYRGSRTTGIPVDGAIFQDVTDGFQADAGATSKIVYRDARGIMGEIYTTDTVAELVAKSNGTVSASS